MKNIFLLFLCILTVNAQGYILAVGGGSEDSGGWSDKPYGWMVEKADSGKIIVISYEDGSNWLPNYFMQLGAEESYILNIDNSTIADDQSTYNDLITAKGIFIKGGNQERYYNTMNGTLSEQAIIEVFQNGGVIGGTSAGAMVLSEFSSLRSVYSDESLKNPLTNYAYIKDDFINIMTNALFDTHFIERGRWGRLVGFIYKIRSQMNREITGIGIDDKTAICIDNNMIGKVYGTGAVSIFQIDERTRIVDQGSKYTIENLKCDQLTENWEFDFNTLSVSYIPSSAREVTVEPPTNTTLSDSYLFGGNSFNDLFNQYFDAFLNSYSSNIIGVLYNSGYNLSADVLIDSLENRNIQYENIEIAADSLNSLLVAEALTNCEAFVVISNDLEKLSLLNDRDSQVGNVFYQKLLDNTPFYYHGNAAKLNGSYFVDGVDTNPNSAYYGRLKIFGGFSNTPEIIYQTEIFENSDFYENRTASVLYGMMRRDKMIGVYLDSEDRLFLNSGANTIEVVGESMPIMVVDGRERTHVDSSKYQMTSTSSERQVVAMNNLRYSVSNLEKSYDLIAGKLSRITSVVNERNESTQNEFYLYNNYPNPFNPSTKIEFTIKPVTRKGSSNIQVKLIVYDILGQKVSTLVDSKLLPGKYKVNINGEKLSSGVYFYRLKVGEFTITKKMLLLR